MKNTMKFITLLNLLCLFSFSAIAQGKMASPRDSVKGKAGNATLSVNYGSPSVKGRQIWGELVPYNKVWRTGANEATVFTCDKDILIEGKPLPKGQYSFFAIPGEKEWILIFNKTVKQWGAYSYDAKDDALRVTVSPKKSANLQERLVYKITETGFSLHWEYLEVAASVK